MRFICSGSKKFALCHKIRDPTYTCRIIRVVTRYIFSQLTPYVYPKCWSLTPKTMRILIPEPVFVFPWSHEKLLIPIPRVVIPDPGAVIPDPGSSDLIYLLGETISFAIYSSGPRLFLRTYERSRCLDFCSWTCWLGEPFLLCSCSPTK